MPVGPKKCKGCGVQVANPVTCPGCRMFCHPGSTCLSRSGHPWYDGSLLNCRSGSPRPITAVNQSIASLVQTQTQTLSTIPTATLQSHSSLPTIDAIKDTIKEQLKTQLAAFRSEMLSVLKTELSDMKSEIKLLSDRVKALEDKSSIPSEQQPSSSADDVIEELNDREQRSRNVLIFNMPEPKETSLELARSADAEGARSILRKICPLVTQTQTTYRLGKLGTTPCRPLCVWLDSAATIKSILQNKHRYKGPAKISDHKTRQQRETL
ncbi:uncharacterized protein LOC143372037 [Andrena cerasifolii]|uniref:uncharacterized protein LOC143372037 n=1 Tax=Andrena cerasifolii TaxID=2819439 RepID=UPI004037D13A